jgi:hypothetical protein
MTKKEQLDKYGWILIKNFFTKEEITSYRNSAEKNKNHKGDLLSCKELNKVIYDTRILDILKECLDSETLYYFGDSSMSYNSEGNGYHKDSRDRKNKNSPEFKDLNYSLLRYGIYLQDHSKHSRGLSLRSKSHLMSSVFKGKKINVETEVGDLVIWKLTTTHSGNAERISFLPKLVFNPYVTRLFPDFIKQKSINPRIVFFVCFGLNDNYSKRYIDYLKNRKYAWERWKNSEYDQKVIDILKNKGVTVYKPLQKELDDIDEKELNEKYQQLN